MPGYAPSVAQLQCLKGQLSPAEFACGEEPCAAPNVSFSLATCQEGSSVAPGSEGLFGIVYERPCLLGFQSMIGRSLARWSVHDAVRKWLHSLGGQPQLFERRSRATWHRLVQVA